MGTGGTYGVVTFLAGLLLLLGWLYATAGNARAWKILAKSLLLFALPIMLAPVELFQFPLGLWAWIACEEALKAFASTREQDRIDRFWLVALFGVWELILDKPFWGLAVSQSGESLDHLAMAGLLYVTALPVLMHTVTAAIYAFTFGRRLWAAFIASWVIHTAFNEAVGHFFLSPLAVVIETIVLSAILAAVLKRRPRAPAIERC